MALALLVALACTAVTATRYADYPGGKMPEYGAAGDYDAGGEAGQHSEDYHGHSPDAPASLDYKYEEDQRNAEITGQVLRDSDSWLNPSRQQKELMKHTDDRINKYNEDDEEVSKSRSSHRYKKHRPRLRSEHEPHPRRVMKYSRDKITNSNNNRKDYSEIDRDNFPDDKSKDFEDDVRETTRRARRRKPRDRSMKGYDSDMNRVDEILELERQLKSDDEKEYRPPEGQSRRPNQRTNQRSEQRDRFRPVIDDDDEVKPPNTHRPKAYDEYGDYYDMKRLHSIKEKLPSLLLRKTTVSSPTSAETTEWKHPMELYENRRRLTDPTETAVPISQRPMVPMMVPYDDETTIRVSKTPTKGSRPTYRATRTTTIKPTIESTTTLTPASTTKELSIAEKSRLSILKKAQRKEGVNAESTMKPPVLLQVRDKLQTVVMVEPPSSQKPWLRVREVGADSPQHLERAKKLMRRKLVAEAKNIHELTDNWDEMVCDYIDTALLESTASIRSVNVWAVMLVLFAFIY